MRKLLPSPLVLGLSKTSQTLILFSRSLKIKTSGFTLVELLVVIAILAILGIIGVAILSGTQSRARDAKRREDISAMASSMEAHYVAGQGYSTPLVGTWFSDGIVPGNPGPGGATYYTTYSGAISYIFCAGLENTNGNSTTTTGISGTTTGQYFCKRNAQ